MADAKPSRPAPEIVHSGFFVLRTPLLPIEELTAWSEGLTAAQAWNQSAQSASFDDAWKQDVQLLRARLRSIVARPEIVHALFVASPSLQKGIEHWIRDPDSKKGIQAERALARYFARMAARSTPFGLFSGCSVGSIEEQSENTSLALSSKSDYRVCCRLDFDYLFALTRALQRAPALEMELQYWPNSSLHKIGDAWHYIESRWTKDGCTHHLVRIESDPCLEAAIAGAHGGATVPQLVKIVIAASPESEPSEDEAREYVLELIREHGILISRLTPLLTGKPPLDDIIAGLQSLPAGGPAAAELLEIRNRLCALQHQGIACTPDHYRALTAEIEKLPAKVDPAKLYQVDMIKPAQQAVLGKAVLAELTKAVDLLCRLGQSGEPEELKWFREAFVARYEMAMVPLMEALDEESGIGFGPAANTSDASPLLRGLQLHSGGAAEWKSQRLGVHENLLRQLVECLGAGKTELELDLSGMLAEQADTPALANAFCIDGALAAQSAQALAAGNFEFRLHGGFGPSGARMLGRFCHEDEQMERGVREHLRQEELHHPEAVYAEIVHLPEGRIGNVLCRPVLRQYEIPYMGRSGATPDRQLPIGDLLVGVRENTIVLYSRRLRRQVIPRLTNAHGFLNPRLASVYRFLCYLQHQHGASVPGLSLGALHALDRLPRIRVGRLILSLAEWSLSPAEVKALGQPEGSRRFAEVQKLRRQRQLPRWVVLEEGDNHLPVDLENALSVDAFVHVLKRGERARLLEMFPAPDCLCVTGPEGHFYHELQVLFARKPHAGEPAGSPHSPKPASSLPEQPSPALAMAAAPRQIRVRPPGSDWLYVKLYTGAGASDEILTTAVSPLVHRVMSSGCVSRWFFLRYADPHPHLRIRFHGEPGRLAGELLPLLFERFNPLLTAGKVWQIELDTYQREIERYGGPDALSIAEEVFFADSEAALAIFQVLAGDEGLELRWQIALIGIDSLLRDFQFDENAKRAAVKHWHEGLLREFRVDMPGKRQLAEKFRAQRSRLESLLDGNDGPSREWQTARHAFALRSARNAEALQRLRSLEAGGKLATSISELVSSYAHMHVNRMIRASQRAHELVLYDFLFQLYTSRRSRRPEA